MVWTSAAVAGPCSFWPFNISFSSSSRDWNTENRRTTVFMYWEMVYLICSIVVLYLNMHVIWDVLHYSHYYGMAERAQRAANRKHLHQFDSRCCKRSQHKQRKNVICSVFLYLVVLWALAVRVLSNWWSGFLNLQRIELSQPPYIMHWLNYILFWQSKCTLFAKLKMEFKDIFGRRYIFFYIFAGLIYSILGNKHCIFFLGTRLIWIWYSNLKSVWLSLLYWYFSK